MADPLRPLSDLLSVGFTRLAEQAEAARTLSERVRAALPPAVRAHVVAANRRGPELVVMVDSAAWSARVRYASRQLAKLEAGTERVRVRVVAP